MQKVTIWDMDFFHAKNRGNITNPDVMKISSYHKQLGDQVNFVVKEDDLDRPYDLMYIIKESNKIANPPTHYYLDKRVRWWGKSVRFKVNWKMSDAMLGCRPDYLIYPQHERKTYEEYLRLFNDNGKPLPIMQDWTTKVRKKRIVVTDPYMWCASKKDILDALEKLQTMQKVTFSEPIWVQKVALDKDIKEAFLKLNLAPGVKLQWSRTTWHDFKPLMDFFKEFKTVYSCKVKLGHVLFDYRNFKAPSHWQSKEQAFKDFAVIREAVKIAKELRVPLTIHMPESRFETPYFMLFETIAHWSQHFFMLSWLEYITSVYGFAKPGEWDIYWMNPRKWNEVFRDLLVQTWRHKEFLTHRGGNDYVSENDIPWTIWEREFKFNI